MGRPIAIPYLAPSAVVIVTGLFLAWTLRPVQFSFGVDAFMPTFQRTRQQSSVLFSTTTTTDAVGGISFDDHSRTMKERPCLWKPSWLKGDRWHRRIHLEDLRVGQQLKGTIVQDLLDGKTGPKLFLDVGVGRTNSKGTWNIVNAMLRLERGKASVIQKRAARLRKKDYVDVWVARVHVENGRLEVCLSEDDVQKYQKESKTSVTALRPGTEIRGRVVQLKPYGAMIDVGANRQGLLHILKVRQIYGKYIAQEKGLAEAGLERGAKVRLCVSSLSKRRLELDFTDDVKAAAKAEMEARNEKSSIRLSTAESTASTSVSTGSTTMSELEQAEWAAFAHDKGNRHSRSSTEGDRQEHQESQDEYDDEEDDDEDDYDEYDEERDIEDSLGLGYY